MGIVGERKGKKNGQGISKLKIFWVFDQNEHFDFLKCFAFNLIMYVRLLLIIICLGTLKKIAPKIEKRKKFSKLLKNALGFFFFFFKVFFFFFHNSLKECITFEQGGCRYLT
jgi:hypothetical protein